MQIHLSPLGLEALKRRTSAELTFRTNGRSPTISRLPRTRRRHRAISGFKKIFHFKKKKGRGRLCLFVKMACGRFSECSLCHNAPQSHTSDCPSPTALLLNIRLPADPQCLSEKKNKKKTDNQPSAVEAAACARLSEPPRSRKAPENGSVVAKVEQSSAIKSSSPQKWVHLKSKQKGGGGARTRLNPLGVRGG